MGCDREPASIWFYLFGFSKNYGGSGKSKWKFPWFIKYKIWRSRYFWHDSFGRYLNWVILCLLFGHRKVQNVAEPGEEKEFYCFCCDRKVKEE